MWDKIKCFFTGHRANIYTLSSLSGNYEVELFCCWRCGAVELEGVIE